MGFGSLGLLGGCGESDATSEDDGFAFSCDDPECCVPVGFDAARSRAYLVDGQLELFIASKGEAGHASLPLDAVSRPGELEARVKTELEITYCSFATTITEPGLNSTSCVARPAPGMACGQPTEIELRLRPIVIDPETARSRCDVVPFTKIRWAFTPLCPDCPSEVPHGQACEAPMSRQCDYSEGCGPVGCLCGVRTDSGERAWHCGNC